MQYEKYYDVAHTAAQRFESGDYDGALSNFLSLMESDISDVDKANMCQNIAKVCEKQGRMTEAMEWYDQGGRCARTALVPTPSGRVPCRCARPERQAARESRRV